MKLHGTMSINAHYHLSIGGCDATDLAKAYGTPLYIIDEACIRETCAEFKKYFINPYPGNKLFYASKAFLTKAMAKIIYDEGFGLDVASGGELFTALNSGFSPAKIIFHGNNKSEEELYYAIKNDVGRIMLDNFHEAELLESVCAELDKEVSVIPRLQPGVDTHTHAYIQTGMIDSKFGLAISTGQAMELIKSISSKPHLKLIGIHCHLGSQILELEPYILAAKIMLGFMNTIKAETGLELSELNLGGGLGIYYTKSDDIIPVSEWVKTITETVATQCALLGMKHPDLALEPGRAIIGEAGSTLYSVGSIKTVPGGSTYVMIDGGMTDNPRPALYQAQYEAILANRMADESDSLVTVAGRCCETGDILIRDIYLPEAKPGDLLLVPCTGAYTYSMSSNYNRFPRPAVVLVNNGEADIIVKRETWEDLLRYDVIPDRLNR